MGAIGWMVVAIIVAAGVWAIMTYNGLVSLRQRCCQAFSDIDVQLKQRHDLVPNLVKIVKGYAAHERQTLEASSRLATPPSPLRVPQPKRWPRGSCRARCASSLPSPKPIRT